MAATMSFKMPFFYRVCFVIFDVLLPVFGVFGNLFAPEFMLNNFTPLHVSPPATETILLLDATAGFFASLAFLQVVFWRTKPADKTVWRALEGGTLLLDVFMLVGFTRALISEERTDWTAWRSDDWSNLGGYAAIAAVRAAFLLDVGVGEQSKGKST